MNISNNISTMQSFASSVNKNAINIANANKNASTHNQTDLIKELTNQIITTNGFDANAKSVKALNETLGTVLDMKT